VRTATYLTTIRPFMLVLSGTHTDKHALPDKPVTKARKRFRSHLLHPPSRLVTARVPLQVIAKPCVDATVSQPTSVISSTAVVVAAASARGWGRVVVIRVGAWNLSTGPSTDGA